MVPLVVLNEILLSIEYARTPDYDTCPVLASLVHPHLMLLPVGFSLEGLESLLFRAVGAEHVRLTRLPLSLVVGKQGR
jgi:hypothetical protein